jgi:formamidopyrimidine-DNA glycosylase
VPELPEVETIKRGLSRLIVGKKILDVKASSAKQVKPSLAVVKQAVVGSKIREVKRRAKLLLIYFTNGKVLVVHLKLTGRLLVRKKKAPEDSWQRITFFLSDNLELRFADARKFGWIKLVKDKGELEKLLADFGPEPLDDLTLEKFEKILSSSLRPIKILLMDQKKIAGVGNIYANEALFLAKIHPKRPAKSLTQNEKLLLYKAIKKVLKAGIKYRGASDQYYLDALGHKGAYQKHFLVYGREGKKCPKKDCLGIIKKIKLGGRGTYFCLHCQR